MQESPLTFWITFLCVVAAVIVLAISIRPWMAIRRRRWLEQSKRLFRQHRERLEAKLVDLAEQSGKPRGLKWQRCDFSDEVAFARDCNSGMLTALVALTISFEAVEGGGMEDVEAVGNLRAATAVFFLEGNRWDTHGRVIFNLEPAEAIERFQGVLVRIYD